MGRLPHHANHVMLRLHAVAVLHSPQPMTELSPMHNTSAPAFGLNHPLPSRTQMRAFSGRSPTPTVTRGEPELLCRRRRWTPRRALSSDFAVPAIIVRQPAGEL